MRIANLSGRAVIVTDDGAIDIADASAGEFGPSPASVFEAWDAFVAWAATTTAAPETYDAADLLAPSPAPRQSFGIGLNYRKHADESGVPYPEFPPTFTKFPSCITGPYATVDLPSESVDWEVELVVVIGRRAERVGAADAGRTSPASPSGRTCRNGWCRPARRCRSSASASRSPGSARPGRGSSPPTRWATPTTSPCRAR